jgi:protein-S-isoprenylcysteine O-methyltransferase Ste14
VLTVLRHLFTVLRHLLAIFLLPFMAVVMVPRWLLGRAAAGTWHGPAGAGVTPLVWLSRIAGTIVTLLGFALFGWCVALFARVGRGTLAPWDPTRHLVAVGPYQYVRNPMILSVLLMLVGEALLWRSWSLASWAGLFFVINHAYFMLLEEPGAEARLGESYRIYKANVPRWLPRRTPWIS